MFQLTVEITYNVELDSKNEKTDFDVYKNVDSETIVKKMKEYTEKIELGFMDCVQFHVIATSAIIDLT